MDPLVTQDKMFITIVVLETMSESNDFALYYAPHKWEKPQTFYDLDYRDWLPTAEKLNNNLLKSYKRYTMAARAATHMHIGSWVRKPL